MGDMLVNLVVSAAGSLLAAAILFALARLTTRQRPAAPIAYISRFFGSFPDINATEPRGPILRKPFLLTSLACILFGILVGFVDSFHSPFPTPPPLLTADSPPRQSLVLRNEADIILNQARQQAENLVEYARSRASYIMDEATKKEKAGTAAWVIGIMREDARRVIQRAHEEASQITEDARRRAEKLYQKADEELASEPLTHTSWEPPLRGFVAWPLRVMALIGFLGLILRLWRIEGPTRSGVLACIVAAVIVAAIEAMTPGETNPVVFLLPVWLVAVSRASRQEELSFGESFLGAFKLIYQRFGFVLAAFLFQVILTVMLSGIGGLLSGQLYYAVDQHVLDSVLYEYRLPRVSIEGIIALGTWVGGNLGYEVSSALVLVSFASVLAGRAKRV